MNQVSRDAAQFEKLLKEVEDAREERLFMQTKIKDLKSGVKGLMAILHAHVIAKDAKSKREELREKVREVNHSAAKKKSAVRDSEPTVEDVATALNSKVYTMACAEDSPVAPKAKVTSAGAGKIEATSPEVKATFLINWLHCKQA